MNLIDADRANLLYERMGPAIEASGGSAGNTAAGIASFGGRAAFFGKVAEDTLGEIYSHDIRAQGVSFDTKPLKGPPPTARSMIFVTPDGERSMNTYLGACVELGPEDVEPDKAKGALVTYFEGYLWDPPRAKDAIRLTARLAHEAGRQVSMTLSDSFCVDRYRDEFLDLMRSGTVDIVFANSHEIKSLYQTSSFETALAAIRKDCRIAAVTRSEKGSVIVHGDETVTVERRSRCAKSSIRPAPAIFMPPAFSMAIRPAAASRRAAIWVRWLLASSSSRSVRARATACASRQRKPGCSDLLSRFRKGVSRFSDRNLRQKQEAKQAKRGRSHASLLGMRRPADSLRIAVSADYILSRLAYCHCTTTPRGQE